MCAVPTPYFINALEGNSINPAHEKMINERIRNNEEWPGAYERKDLTIISMKDDPLSRNAPLKANLFTNEILIREASLAGFEILKVEYFGLNLKEKVYVQDCTMRQEASIICYKREF